MSLFARITLKDFTMLSERAVQAVVFDMDGVLIDARLWHYEALNQALEIFGAEIDSTEHQERFDGLPTRVKLDLLTAEGRLPSHVHSLVNRVKQERTLRIAAANNKPNLQHLVLLGWLKSRNIKLGVATNSIRLTTNYMLRSASIVDMFDAIVTNEDVEKPKPNPEIYLESAKRLAVLPQDCLVVEDSETGATAAMAAGMTVLRVDDPSQLSLGLVLPFIESRI